MKKIVEHTYGTHIYMKLEHGGAVYEVDNYAGADGSWEHFKTTADDNPELRDRLIAAFRALY